MRSIAAGPLRRGVKQQNGTESAQKYLFSSGKGRKAVQIVKDNGGSKILRIRAP